MGSFYAYFLFSFFTFTLNDVVNYLAHAFSSSFMNLDVVIEAHLLHNCLNDCLSAALNCLDPNGFVFVEIET